jgi:hypothetical protein
MAIEIRSLAGNVIHTQQGADLQGADLQGADLQGADLQGADLRRADLQGADLREANLREANLRGADLQGANLPEANLQEADLQRANLQGANLEGTCLDPHNKPNEEVSSFLEKEGEYVFGYRTRKSPIAGKILVDDRIYGCEVFSTSDTECHPGWYLWPSKEEAEDYSPFSEIIKVKSRIKDMHKAGNKWRSRTIHVIGPV